MNNETSTKAVQRSSQSPILKCLVLLVFVVSAANIIIGHRSNLIDYMDQQYQQQSIPLYKDAPTVERTAEDTNDVHSITLQQQQNDINGDTIIHDGAFITDILTDKQPFPTPQNNPHHHHHRLKFLPGTLHLTSAQSLQHCHVNTTTYAKHFPDVDTLLVSVSHKHKLIYRNVPKSSSSSARHAMQDFLEGVDKRMKSRDMNENVHGKNYTLVSFIRDPLQRFYSSYDEGKLLGHTVAAQSLMFNHVIGVSNAIHSSQPLLSSLLPNGTVDGEWKACRGQTQSEEVVLRQ